MDELKNTGEYHAIYKCRLCGEAYDSQTVCGKQTAFLSLVGLTSGEFYYPKGSGIGLHRYDMHQCKNGDYGFADFLGSKYFQKTE